MDVKDPQSEATLSERINDGSKYASSGVTLPYNRNKPYHDVNSVSLGKVDATPARPCAVIGPDRVMPPPVSSDAIKKSVYDAWCADNVYRHPPEYPHKMTNYHTPIRNISPRQTFQENMQRIMVPPTYNSLKGNEEHNFPMDKHVSMPKNIKTNIPIETKYCEVPYPGNPTSNEQKSVRNAELSASNVNPVLARSGPQGWPPHVRPSRPYGAPELYQYPEYTNCAGPRPVPMTRTHRTAHEDLSHTYPGPYCHDVRFKPYTTVKERYPQARYEYISNYSNPFHPPSAFPPKYDIQKPIPQPYPYQQVPLKYLDSRIPDTVIDGYQRPPQQGNYNLPYHNQMIHPAYGPIIGNCIQNKFPCPPENSVKPVPPNKLPYEANKMYAEYENARSKPFSISENYYFNEMQRPPHHVKNQVLPNYPVNMHGIPPHPYYRKDGSTLKNYEYMPHFRNVDPSMLAQSRMPSQFSPNGITISPSDPSLNLDTTQIQPSSQEDYGFLNQSPTSNIRNMDFAVSRNTNEFYRRYDSRYGPTIRPPPIMAKSEQNPNENSKDKKNIDVRQFLQMWSEVDDENAENVTKEVVAHFPNDGNKIKNQYETVKNQDQLYVLGLVNVPSEELGKYEHIQKVSKLPENIKGYNSIELLNQFEEVIESSNEKNFKNKLSTSEKITYQMPIKNEVHHSLGLLPRPVSPLDVEAKISQSVIHKEVGCNFEIKPCSPKMLNVEAATPIQNLLSERAIEKVSNPLIPTPPLLHVDEKLNRNILNQEKRKSPNENVNNTSCKMINTQFSSNDSGRPNYSLQDLESNSGVCLASLPRLDNDIELNFQEVNQQFINANKGESVITATKDLPSLNLEHIENVDSPNTDRIRQKSDKSYDFPSADAEREFSKLSKYRKIKKCTELVEKDTLTFSLTQNMRTDSVIIKNPENTKIFEQNKDVLAIDSPIIRVQDVPNKDNFVDKIGTIKDLSKLDTEVYSQMDMAIDFSLNKNDSTDIVSSPIDYFMQNQPLNSPKIDFPRLNNPTNRLEVSQDDCTDSTKKQNEENEFKHKIQISEQHSFTAIEIDNKNELQADLGSIENKQSDILTIPKFNDLSELNTHKNIDEIITLENLPPKLYDDDEEAVCELNSQPGNVSVLNNEANKNTMKKQKTSCVSSFDNIVNDEIIQDTDKVNTETKIDKVLETDRYLGLPDLNEEIASISYLNEYAQKDDEEMKSDSLLTKCGEKNEDAGSKNEKVLIQEEIDTNTNYEGKSLEEKYDIVELTTNIKLPLENENHEKTLNEFAKHEIGEICHTKQIYENKDTLDESSENFVTLKNKTINNYEDVNDELRNAKETVDAQSKTLCRDRVLSETESIIQDTLIDNSQDNNNTSLNLKELQNLKNTCILLNNVEDTNHLPFVNSQNLVIDSLNSNKENDSVEKDENNGLSNINISTIKSFDDKIIVERSITPLESNSIIEERDENLKFLNTSNDIEIDSKKSSCKEICKYNIRPHGLQKELYSPFITKLLTNSEGPLKPHIVKPCIAYKAPNSSPSYVANNKIEQANLGDHSVFGKDSKTSTENRFDGNVVSKNLEIILRDPTSEGINEAAKNESLTGNNNSVFEESIEHVTYVSPPDNDIKEVISSELVSISTVLCNESSTENENNITTINQDSNESTCNENTLENYSESSDNLQTYIHSPSNKKYKDNLTTVTEKNISQHNDDSCIININAEDQKDNNNTIEQVTTKQTSNEEFIDNNDMNIECSINTDLLQGHSHKTSHNKHIPDSIRPSLKRSLSDSALDSFNDSSDAFYSGWRPKRAKKFCNILESEILFEPNSQNNRRKSISSIYNEQNVSFCILIDNNCIITEEESEEQDGLCFTEISEACLRDLQESSNEYDEVVSPHPLECPEVGNHEYSETQDVEESWVDDVGCMETVVSDDVAEDITISASSSPERIQSPDNEESGVFINSDHTDKVKHIYGDKMCNDDVMFLETLYRTPQMNVNKIINGESQIADECIQYYNKDSLEKVLSESNSCEDLRSDVETLTSDANSYNPPEGVKDKNVDNYENFHTRQVLATEEFVSICETYDKIENNDFHNKDSMFTTPDITQDDTVHSCESSIDNVFTYNQSDEYSTCTSSTSPEVSSTTSEERNSSILLKITNYKGTRISQINDFEQETKSISCKFTELNDYSSSQNFKSKRPLITKAAQKYIPPLEETLGDLKIRLPLPQHSLLRLKQLKLLKEAPKLNKCNTKSKPDIPKKPRPKFEDVLKSIDEIQFKRHKEKSKKNKKSIPKVVIKKSENGSHYASTANREPYSPDLTGRKWQPWVFLEKNQFIDKMALRNKRKAIFSHRKNTYVLAEKFRKYKSIGNAKFVISQPNIHHSSIGHLKCTIRLKHTY